MSVGTGGSNWTGPGLRAGALVKDLKSRDGCTGTVARPGLDSGSGDIGFGGVGAGGRVPRSGLGKGSSGIGGVGSFGGDCGPLSDRYGGFMSESVE